MMKGEKDNSTLGPSQSIPTASNKGQVPLCTESNPTLSESFKTKNLTFFKRFYPEIFKKLSSFEPVNTRLAVHKESNKLDIFEGTASWYQGDMVSYCRKEVDLFITRFSVGNHFKSTKASTAELYESNRFFSRSIKKSMYRGC